MNRSERYRNKPKRTFITVSSLLIILSFILVFAVHLYLKSTIKIEAPEKELGRKVIVAVPDGKEILTYENLIIKEDGKMFYIGEDSKIDLTGGIVVYQDWD